MGDYVARSGGTSERSYYECARYVLLPSAPERRQRTTHRRLGSDVEVSPSVMVYFYRKTSQASRQEGAV